MTDQPSNGTNGYLGILMPLFISAIGQTAGAISITNILLVTMKTASCMKSRMRFTPKMAHPFADCAVRLT